MTTRTRSARIFLVLFALVIAGFIGRTLVQRSQERAAAAAPPKAAPALELREADTFVVRPQTFNRTLTISGGLKAVNSATVRAKVAAEVKTLSVREGDMVKAGQVIGQLDTLEVDLKVQQAEQNAAASKAQLDIARRTLENNRALVDKGFISGTALDTSISNEAAARATWQATVTAVDLARKARGDARLVAPLSGLVSQRLVQPGERVSVDAKIIEVVDLSRIELEAAVAPEDVGGVAIGQKARLAIAGIDEPVTAHVARVNPSTQAGTRAVMVYLAVDAHPALRQGLFSTGQIDLRTTQALAVPVSAVRVDQAQPYVLAVTADRVERRTVTLGQRGEMPVDGRLEAAVELATGVADGTRVLRGVAGGVRDGAVVRMVPSASASASVADVR
jgi:RND family efflux transporter MFP subunit